jgi:hypothetical protein
MTPRRDPSTLQACQVWRRLLQSLNNLRRTPAKGTMRRERRVGVRLIRRSIRDGAMRAGFVTLVPNLQVAQVGTWQWAITAPGFNSVPAAPLWDANAFNGVISVIARAAFRRPTLLRPRTTC